MRDVTILAIVSLRDAFVRRAPHQHDLFDIKVETGCVMLRQYRDALRAFPIRQILQNRITDLDIPGPRRKQTVNALQKRTLPAPIRPDDARQLSAFEGNRHILQHLLSPITGRDMID